MSPESPDDVAIDWEAALGTAGGDRALLQELVDAFLDESRTLAAGIERAIEERNGAEVHRQAHSLKGAIRFFGATGAAEAAMRMEQAGRDGDLGAALKLFGPLQHELEKLRSALAAGRPGRGDPGAPR